MISGIFGALAALPQVLKLVESFIAWVTDQINQAKIAKANNDAKLDAEKAQANKDTSGLDNLFDPGKKP